MIFNLLVRIINLWADFQVVLSVYIQVVILLAVFFFLVRKVKIQWFQLMVINILVFFFLFATVFIGVEAYFRYIYDATDLMKALKVTERWFKRHVRLNSHGFRDKNFSGLKTENEIRVGVLGDSFAFGHGVSKVEDRFSDILEQRLKKQNANFVVYNMAKPAWNSKEEIAYFLADGEQFDFDYLILSYYLNDIWPDGAFDPPPITRNWLVWRNLPLINILMDNSYAFEFFAFRIFGRLDDTLRWVTNYEISLFNDEESFNNHQQTLLKLINYSQKKEIPLIVLIFPYLENLDDNYPADEVHKKINKFFHEQNVVVIDLLEIFQQYGTNHLIINHFDPHPNKLGHSIAADKLYEVFEEMIETKSVRN